MVYITRAILRWVVGIEKIKLQVKKLSEPTSIIVSKDYAIIAKKISWLDIIRIGGIIGISWRW